ncbi:Down syndrome cell adhesion molecule-like protein Dscam2 isoform X4 [Cryptotermes secundus]|uniref:Down syndrome cell adhesion molecule-like protein Dscam2 isoform X4 n=1 Tax=Cryptotermes secundus TaxID=105785 RepID=UPI001454BC7F|nr:Down syndrome cell adhesion molecule-like protein Dscam2 isoform X4 [Cryptotermes secundus]
MGRLVARLVVSAAVCLLLTEIEVNAGSLYDTQGPVFVGEPPPKVEFTNSSGGRVDCSARGNPEPTVEWLGPDNLAVTSIPGIRLVLNNGSIYFPPFDAEVFRQDVHWAVYRCVVANSVGTIISREVTVRAVVTQRYEPEVQSPGGFLGNDVIIRCNVPAFVKEHVTVTSWLQEPAFNIYPSTVSDGKYHMLPSGELMVLNITASDAMRSYRCRTHHQLTQEAVVSRNVGRIQLTDIRGPVPPVLNERLLMLTAKVDDTVVVPCVAYANPRPQYRWMYHQQNGHETALEGTERHIVRDGTLVITAVRESDAGTYLCNASNKEGSETLEVQLSISSPLQVLVHPSRQRVDLGKSATFRCSVSGFPRTSIHWLKDGQPLRTGARIRQPSEDRVHISAVLKEDRGMYQCFVKNQIEMAQGSAELRLGEVYPQLAYKFIEQTLQPGSSVSLKCSASGNPTPRISWTLDGFSLPHNERLMIGQYVTVFGDVISHVNISTVKPDDGGEYECVAENRAGRTSHAARLNIYGLPYVRPMPPIPAVAGQQLVVKCPVAGYPIDTIIWEKDGVRLPTNIRQRVTNGTLTVENVQRASDQGTYSCTARNKQNYTAQRSVDIRVLVPPKITPFSFARDLNVGDRTSIQCVVVTGDLPLSFIWLKDHYSSLNPTTSTTSISTSSTGTTTGTDITTRQYDDFTSTLSIGSITRAHSGNYTCRVSNAAATVTHTAQLQVNVPPRWMVEPTDHSVVQGNPVSLHCQVDGFPKPTVTWKKAVGTEPGEYRDLSYHSQRIHSLENGSLIISRATQEHEGYYLCQAGNGIGPGLSKVILLTVHAGPRFKVRTRQEMARKGETVHLRCEADGDQPMDVTWKAKGSRIESDYEMRYSVKTTSLSHGSLSKLTIMDVSPVDRGDFTCIASNAYGQDRTTIQLTVQEPPNFPRNLHIAEQTSRSVLLSWSPGAGSDSPVTSYILQYKEASDIWHEHNPQLTVAGDRSVVLVAGLRPATVYHFRLYAENALGTSAPSDPLHAMTESEIPGGAPRQVSVEATSSQELHVTWQPPERQLWNGELLGYKIGFKRIGPVAEDEGPYNFTRIGAGMVNSEVRLSGLEKFTKYSVIVEAFNNRGDGPSCDPVIVQTLEDVPSAPPQDVICTPVSAHDLQVSWHPPDRSHLHGIVQGYKLFYEPVEERYEPGKRESKVTTATTAVLHGLKPFTNYSIRLLASTRAGDGVVSPVTFCTTEETVPEAPEKVKAVPSSENAAFVGWLPPHHPNGIVTKYTVHLRILEQGRELKTVKNPVAAHQLYYEVSGLFASKMYEAWVTAATRVGQGAGTSVIRLSPAPSSSVPASIVSFGQLVTVPWKVTVKLACLCVGKPRPSAEWRLGDLNLHHQPKMEINSDNTLIIMNVLRSNEGNYSCHVRNTYGSDEIMYFLQVQVPPAAPVLVVTSVMQKSVQLQWKQGDTGGAAVRQFLLAYRSVGEGGEAGEWDELSIEPGVSRRLLEGLLCGTHYQFRLAAVNKIGSGSASPVIDVTTKGSKPEAPKLEHFLQVNMTSVTLLLDTWQDGGCQIRAFTIEYRETAGGSHWKLVASSIVSQQSFILQALIPATRYALRVSARNPAGTTVAQYIFVTRSTIPGQHQHSSDHDLITGTGEESGSPFYMDTQVVIPAAVSAIAVVGAFIAVVFCLHRRPGTGAAAGIGGQGLDAGSGLQDATAALDNKHNAEQRERYYATVRKPAQLQSPGLERIPEYSEDIYPYATFHLAEQETMAGNPQMPMQQVFGYECCPVNSIQSKQCDPEHHLKTRSRAGRKSKPHKSESEEYDSLGSDSDTEQGTSSRTESSNHLDDPGPGAGRAGIHRPAHHNFLYHTQESSTSTEPSPISEHRTFPCHNKLRRCTSEMLQVESEALVLPPSGFGDVHTHELSEAECDIGMDINLARKIRLHSHDFTIAV